MSWDWSIFWRYREAWLYGAWMTIKLSLLTVLFGTLLGAALALAKRSRNPILRLLANIYIEFFRAVPPLVLLLWIHYVAPVLGIKLPAFVSAVISLVLNLAAFAAENVRAGLETVPKEQLEAAAMEGATRWQMTWYVVLPQAVRNMLPNLLDECIAAIKVTSLASVIGIDELVNRATSISANSYRQLEVYTALAIWYLVIILPFVFVVRILERKLAERNGG